MDINYVAVIVAAILNMVIGAVWYSPLLFAKPWMKATGKKTMGDVGNPAPGYVLTSVGSLVIAFVMAYLIGQLDISDFWGGAVLGLVAWLGFVVPTQGANYIFEGRPLKLFNINVGYSLVGFVVMAGVIAAMS